MAVFWAPAMQGRYKRNQNRSIKYAMYKYIQCPGGIQCNVVGCGGWDDLCHSLQSASVVRQQKTNTLRHLWQKWKQFGKSQRETRNWINKFSQKIEIFIKQHFIDILKVLFLSNSKIIAALPTYISLHKTHQRREKINWNATIFNASLHWKIAFFCFRNLGRMLQTCNLGANRSSWVYIGLMYIYTSQSVETTLWWPT